MKCVIEFGVRGGFHVDNIIVPSAKLAQKIAFSIAKSYGGNMIEGAFSVSRKSPREGWSNSTHFVAVSMLDGVMRGSASAALWKK